MSAPNTTRVTNGTALEVLIAWTSVNGPARCSAEDARLVPRADIGSPVLIDWNRERLTLLRNQEVDGSGPGRRIGIADGMHAFVGI
jgi:hypothetical protein